MERAAAMVGPELTRELKLRDAHAFRARSLRALTLVKGHGLPFAQLVEPRALARRVVEEVLVSVFRQDEAEALVADEPLDLAVHRCCLPFMRERLPSIYSARPGGHLNRSQLRRPDRSLRHRRAARR